jgi:hypothetical protein
MSPALSSVPRESFRNFPRLYQDSGGGTTKNLLLPLFEIASVHACLDHVASFIVNADHGIM